MLLSLAMKLLWGLQQKLKKGFFSDYFTGVLCFSWQRVTKASKVLKYENFSLWIFLRKNQSRFENLENFVKNIFKHHNYVVYDFLVPTTTSTKS